MKNPMQSYLSLSDKLAEKKSALTELRDAVAQARADIDALLEEYKEDDPPLTCTYKDPSGKTLRYTFALVPTTSRKALSNDEKLAIIADCSAKRGELSDDEFANVVLEAIRPAEGETFRLRITSEPVAPLDLAGGKAIPTKPGSAGADGVRKRSRKPKKAVEEEVEA